MLPSYSGILAEAISIVSTSLQQGQSISLASFLESVSLASSGVVLLKKVFLKSLQSTQAFILAQVFLVNFAKF